jgi:hypothetical protein
VAGYPSFFYDQYRPGIETDTDGQVWNQSRDKLERIIHGSAKNIGATLFKTNFEGEKPDQATGDVMLMSLARQEPPMTAEEAVQFGVLTVIAWDAIREVEELPDFCDTIFPISGLTEVPEQLVLQDS